MGNKIAILIIVMLFTLNVVVAEVDEGYRILYSIRTFFNGQSTEILIVENQEGINKTEAELDSILKGNEELENNISSLQVWSEKMSEQKNNTIAALGRMEIENAGFLQILEERKSDYNRLKEKQKEIENKITTHIFLNPQLFVGLVVVFILLISTVVITRSKKYFPKGSKTKKSIEEDVIKSDLEMIKEEIEKMDNEDKDNSSL